MSRIGKSPIPIPDKVSVSLDGLAVTVKGPKGELKRTLPDGVSVDQVENTIVVAPSSSKRTSRERHGLCRTLVANMIEGFSNGYSKKLEIVGTLLSSDLETVDRAGVPNLQLTIRAGIELRGGGRSIWSTTLFGRGRVPVKEGLSGAVKASFERLVRELLRDDYFLLELQ